MKPAPATVIYYHAVGDCPPEEDPYRLFVPPALFEAQMAFLARRRRVVDLHDLVQGEADGSPPAVAITFDDGYLNVLREAGPIMARFGFPSTNFVPTAWIGRQNDWVDPPLPRPAAIMSEAEMAESERCGIRIESHGHGHIDFEKASAEEARQDLQRSIELLGRILGRSPRYLAFPFGRSSEAARAAAAEAGFEAAFVTDKDPETSLHRFERVPIRRNDTPAIFRLKTSGRYLSWRRSGLGTIGRRILSPALKTRHGG